MKKTLLFMLAFLMIFASFSSICVNGSVYTEHASLEKVQESVSGVGAGNGGCALVLTAKDSSSNDFDPLAHFERFDVDQNGEWAIGDITFVLNFLSETAGEGDPTADVNGDGACNIVDVNCMLNTFNQGCLHKKAVDPGVSATCREPGLTEGSHCALCGEVFSARQQTDLRPHIYVCDVCVNCGLYNPEFCSHKYTAWETVTQATCDTEGLRSRTCPLCERTEEEKISALGHRWEEWRILKEATIFEEGVKTRGCTVCGDRENQTIPVYVPSDAEKMEMARKVAQEIADSIPAGTDLERVSAAAQIVSEYCSRCVYTSEGKDYRQAYGVFIKGEYTCAGATRALGMVLECMGYKWTHKNENQWTHQWCVLEMDGQIGFADGQVGWAGYGKHPVDYDEE